ncbi:MAG TPA: hypothetical protein VF604_04230 [Pyrinomonadaceae bacterium]|jgi:hypothetical protein
MKNKRNLEISAGFATQTILLSYLCFLVFTFDLVSEVTGMIHDGIVMLAVPWFFSLLVAFGAYFHATKGSVAALLTLCFGAFTVIIILGLFWLFFISWTAFSRIGLIFNIVTLVPIVLAGITLIIAFSSDMAVEVPRTKRLTKQ